MPSLRPNDGWRSKAVRTAVSTSSLAERDARRKRSRGERSVGLERPSASAWLGEREASERVRMGIVGGAASAADPGRSRDGPVSLAGSTFGGVGPVESRLGTATSDEPGLTGGIGRGDPVGELCGAVRGELIPVERA
eukprot:scaffold13502_cov70-Phaeocystis_antarctica.AAC.9